MTQSQLKNNVLNSFQSNYITLISVIQGALLGLLFSKYGELISKHGFLPFDYQLFIRVLICAVIIFLLWKEYSNGSTFYTWIPDSLDLVIPFLLALSQAILISSINSKSHVMLFVIFFFVFSITGAWGYKNLFSKVKNSSQYNVFLYPESLKDSKNTMPFIKISILIMIIMIVFSYFVQFTNMELIFEIICLTLLLVMVYIRENSSNRIMKIIFDSRTDSDLPKSKNH